MTSIVDAREAFLDLAADGKFEELSEEREEYGLTGREEAWTRLLVALGFSRKHDESWADAIQRAVEEE